MTGFTGVLTPAFLDFTVMKNEITSRIFQFVGMQSAVQASKFRIRFLRSDGTALASPLNTEINLTVTTTAGTLENANLSLTAAQTDAIPMPDSLPPGIRIVYELEATLSADNWTPANTRRLIRGNVIVVPRTRTFGVNTVVSVS